MFVRTMSRSTSSGMVTTPSTPALPCWTHRSFLPARTWAASMKPNAASTSRICSSESLATTSSTSGTAAFRSSIRSGSQSGIRTLGRPRAGAAAARVVARVAAPAVPARNVRRFISGLSLEVGVIDESHDTGLRVFPRPGSLIQPTPDSTIAARISSCRILPPVPVS